MKKDKGLFFVAFAIVFLLIFYGGIAFAGTTGKISGKIIDAATKQTIPGATIMIDGTKMGNKSNADGSYFIINVPPGTYSVTASCVGYAATKTTQVVVEVDKTVTINFNLQTEAIDLKKVIEVVAKKDIITKDVTANERTISASSMEKMAVKDIGQLLAAQVGFVTRNSELHVRGGRAGEVLYLVDGVETRDPLGGLGLVKGGMNVSTYNVEELDLLKGGFDAEYGNVQSAAVNIVTREGSNRVTQGHLEYMTDDFGNKGLNKYSFNSDRVEFSLSGPEPFLTQKILPALGINLAGEKLSYYFSADVWKTNTNVDVNKYATPITAKKFRVDNILGFDIPERMNNSYSASLKLSYKASPSKNLVFSYRGTWDRYTMFFNPTSATRGDNNVWWYRYTPMTLPQYQQYSSIYSLKFTHQVSPKTMYNIALSRFLIDFLQRPGHPTKPGQGVDPGDFVLYTDWEYFTDVNRDGKWNPSDPYVDGNQNTVYDPGEAFEDVNQDKNGRWDPGEAYIEGNGEPGYQEGEDYFNPTTMDRPGKGRWTGHEPLVDTNGDSAYNPERARMVLIDLAEPYDDGDVNLGETFDDVDDDGIYTVGIDFFDYQKDDLNGNGKYDSPQDTWSPGVPFKDLNHNGVYDAANGRWDPGEPYTDSNGNGKWDNAGDGFFDRGYERRCYYQHRQSLLTTLKFDLTSQIHREHELKTGWSLEFDKLTLADLRYPYYPYDGQIVDGGPWPDRGTFRDFYSQNPIRGSWYLQDKIEYGQMIARLGVRHDFFLQGSDINQLAEELSSGQAQKKVVHMRNKVSPRLGVSYPITDKAKVFFNYGHFYQLPELHFMYARATQASNAAGIIGNYNLDYMKQIQYELGLQYAVSENYRLEMSGFYKDYYGQLNTYQQKTGPITRDIYDNVDYARARGLELQLDKRAGNYIGGYINYQFAFAFGKSSEEVSNYYANNAGQSVPITENPLDWDVRHQLTLNLDLRIPPREHPSIFGLKVPDKWGLNVLWQFSSGFPYTPDKTYPGISKTLFGGQSPGINSLRMPSTSNMDLRFNKDFKVWKMNYSFIVWITNLLNAKNVYDVNSTTGREDTSVNGWFGIVNEYVVLAGREVDQSPMNYGPGRNVRLALSVNF
jgi:outer membrane receptor protein involved in Fe transport